MDLFLHFAFYIFIFINSASIGLNQEVCDSNTGPVCCDGYYRDQITGNCIRCKPGYFDLNCSKKCGYPTYGEQCQKICSCPRKQCNFSYGCIAYPKESDEYRLYLFSSGLYNRKSKLSFVKRKEMNTVINTYRNYRTKDRSTTPSVMIIGNESRILKSDSDKNISDHWSFFSAFIIAITICATLLLGVIITAAIKIIRKYVCRRKDKIRQKSSPLIMSDPIRSQYYELHSISAYNGIHM